ncbi:MAG: hypothetical protein R2715_22045 [Ilumatobacteraceae bacterium]
MSHPRAGNPLVWAVHDSPASWVTYTAGTPPGLVREPPISAIHQEHPQCRGLGVELDRESDVTDLAGHVMRGPASSSVGRAIDPAVVLLIDPIRLERMHPQTVGVLPELGYGRGRSRLGSPD